MMAKEGSGMKEVADGAVETAVNVGKVQEGAVDRVWEEWRCLSKWRREVVELRRH